MHALGKLLSTGLLNGFPNRLIGLRLSHACNLLSGIQFALYRLRLSLVSRALAMPCSIAALAQPNQDGPVVETERTMTAAKGPTVYLQGFGRDDLRSGTKRPVKLRGVNRHPITNARELLSEVPLYPERTGAPARMPAPVPIERCQ